MTNTRFAVVLVIGWAAFGGALLVLSRDPVVAEHVVVAATTQPDTDTACKRGG